MLSAIRNKLLPVIVLIIFILYWIATVIYNSPNNYIRIELRKQLSIFEIFFYQKWTFFTPPGHDNEKVYFEYVEKKDSTKMITLEIMEIIFNEKRKAAPFNMKEELIDDFISNSAIAINSVLYKNNKYFQSLYPDSSKQFCTKMAIKSLNDLSLDFPATRTLFNYSKIVAKKNLNNSKDYKVRIIVTSVSIPRFKDRYLPAKALEKKSNLIYKSTYFDL